MNVFDEEKISEKIVSSYIRALKARNINLLQNYQTEMMEEKSATIQLIEGRYSLKDVNLNSLTYDVEIVLESEIYSIAKEKGIEIAENISRCSLTNLDEIRKKVCPELVKKLPAIIDRIEIKGRKLADFKK